MIISYIESFVNTYLRRCCTFSRSFLHSRTFFAFYLHPRTVCAFLRITKDRPQGSDWKLGIAMRGIFVLVVPRIPQITLCSALRKIPPLAVCGPAFAYGALCLTRLRRHKKKTKHKAWSSFYGGGSWIRTSEVSDNRFTVCPLWPLGNSPINTGAGERSRTINLLITNQLLCH